MVTGLTHASSAPASSAAADGVPQLLARDVVEVGLEHQAAGPIPRRPLRARWPTTTWVQFGRSASSPAPPPKPDAVIVMSGMGPNDVHSAARIAAPVGVVSSTPTSRPYVGTPSSKRTVAGAGLGSHPWALRTVPVPVATAERRDGVDAEDLERGGRPDDVDDGVVAADLVEVHLVERSTVQGRLDAGERVEDGQRPLGHPRRERGVLDQRADGAVGAHHDVVAADDDARVQAMPPRSASSKPRSQPGSASRSRRVRTSSASAPASTREPRAMSPAMPAKQWNQATVGAGGLAHGSSRATAQAAP